MLTQTLPISARTTAYLLFFEIEFVVKCYLDYSIFFFRNCVLPEYYESGSDVSFLLGQDHEI